MASSPIDRSGKSSSSRWRASELVRTAQSVPVGAVATVAAVGAALAVSGLLVQRRTRRAERDHPPVGRFVRVDGVHLHYLDRGRGQPLVLLHGNDSMSSDFDIAGLVEAASRNYRVIAFDRPGFGHSERPLDRVWTPEAQAALLHKALALIGIKQPIVFGHGSGAQVAVAMGLKYPQSVKSLVLASGYYYPTPRLGSMASAIPAVPLLGTLLRHTVQPWIGRMLWSLKVKQRFGPGAVTRRFETGFPVWMSLRPSQLRSSAAESALTAASAMSFRGRYRELQMPVVLVAGEDDRVVSAHQQTARLHHTLALSEMRIVPGAGHMLHHVNPQEVMLAIDRVAQAGNLGEISGVAPFGSQPKTESTRYVRANAAKNGESRSRRDAPTFSN